jgi:hypothetical protein
VVLEASTDDRARLSGNFDDEPPPARQWSHDDGETRREVLAEGDEETRLAVVTMPERDVIERLNEPEMDIAQGSRSHDDPLAVSVARTAESRVAGEFASDSADVLGSVQKVALPDRPESPWVTDSESPLALTREDPPLGHHRVPV